MTKFYLAATLFVAAFAGQANAALITIAFEGHSNTQYDNTSIVRSGFTIANPIGEQQHFHEITSTDFGLPNNGTGVLLNDRNTRIQVTEVLAPGTFQLSSVDVASASNNFPAIGITINGYLNDVLTGTISIGTLGSGYESVNGSSLGIIDRLEFDGIGGGGGFVLDNLTLETEPQVSAVPEPTTLSIFGLGGLSLACSALRRRRKAAGGA